MFYQVAKYFCSCFVVVLLLAACGASEQAGKYLERGKAYYEEGNYDKARVELKNVLQIDPKSVDGHYYLALTLERKQNLQKAFSHFLAVLEIEPKNIPAQLKVGKYYLLSQRSDKAMEVADSILADEPDNPEGIALRGSVLARQGDQAGALREAERAYQLAPENREAILLLSSVYLEANNTDKAAVVLKKGIGQHPDTAIFRMKLMDVYWRSGDNEALEKLLRESIAHSPRNSSYVVQLAQLYAAQNRLDDAEKVLRDSVTAEHGGEDRELLLVRFLREKRGVVAARAELLDYLEHNQAAYKVGFGLADLYRETGKPEQAEQIYLSIIEANEIQSLGLQARNELALLRLDEGEEKQAEQLVAEVLEVSPTDPLALMTRGRMAMRRGEAKKAIADFRTILQDNPASDSILVLLAKAHMRNSEPELAQENLRRAIKINPQALEARYMLITSLTLQKEYDDALLEVAELLKTAPSDRRGLLAMVDLNVIKEDWKRAELAADKIKQGYPEQAVGNLKLGSLYATQKRYDAALKELELAANKAPGQADIVAALVKTLVAKGDGDKAISRLRQEIKTTPANRGEYYNLLGDLYLSRKQEQQAIDAFRNAVAARPKWFAPARTLANLYLLRGDSAAAIRVAHNVAQAAPESNAVALFLAGLYERSAKYDDAIRVYGEILDRDSASVLAANNLASLLTDHKGDAASLRRALELAGRFEDSANPAYIDTLGWIYYKSGNTARALALLKKAQKAAPATPIFNFHLGMAYYAAGEKALARQHLQSVVDSEVRFPGSDEARKILNAL